MKGFNVLITGGAGFVGSNLTKMLLSRNRNVSVTVVDNLLSAEKFNIPDDKYVKFIEGSIADDKILKQINDTYDYVFHLATYHGNISSIHNPLADHENNTLTTLKLFERIKYFKKIRKVVYSSAGCSVAKKTYGPARATTENSPVEIAQDSPYSISKIIGEFYSLYYFRQHGLPVVRARFQNVYGPGEILGAGKWRGTPATVWRNVTPVFIYKSLRGLPLPVENKGIATRDFIYVDDICRGLIACAKRGMEGDVYNLATEKQTTILQLSKTINRITGSKSEIEFLPKRNWDKSGKRYGSGAKAKREIGFSASVNLEDGLRKTIEWSIENLPLIEKCIAKHKKHMLKI